MNKKHTKNPPKLKSVFRHYMKFVRLYPVGHSILIASYGGAVVLSSIYVPILYKQIVNIVSEHPVDAAAQLLTILMFLVLAIVAYNVLFRTGDYLIIKLQSTIMKHLSDYVMEELQKKSYTYFSNAFVGSVVAKTKRFVQSFEALHDQFFFTILFDNIVLVGVMLVLVSESVTLGVVFLVWSLLFAVLVRFMVKWQIPKSIANAEADSRVTGVYSDVLSNILTVKMFGSEKREQEMFEKVTHTQENLRRIAWMQQSFWSGMLQGAFIAVFNIVMIWVAIEMWLRGSISAGTIVLVQVYMVSIFNIVWRMSKEMIRISTALSNAYEMVKILDEPNTVEDTTDPKQIAFEKGKVRFDNVTFGYEGNGHVFRNLDITIAPGEKIALVGHSGAGKTTVIKLILRFLDLIDGTISIDGQDITKVSQTELRRHISYVPQEPLLFHRSLHDNIAYAKPGASREEVVEIAKRAQVHDFVSKLPQNYDTFVGERGVKLSGGERQRVAIARAMLKEAPIVVLDEATSSLDSLSEQKIQEAFNRLMKGKTTIVIAHRLSTIRHMDRILVFDQGRVVEEGSHDVLLQKEGIYAELWSSQVGGFISE